jgi:branched-chain amino acid transport system permease protein
MILGFDRTQAIGLAILLALIVLAPAVVYPVFLMKVLCFALFAAAFNLLLGYAGLLSFGHAAYFGMGSYVSAWVAGNWGLPAESCIMLGGLVGAAMGAAFGWLAIRRAGVYFSMITLALAQMTYFFCLQVPFTGGEDGIQRVPRAMLGGFIPLDNDKAMYALVAAVFVGGFLLIRRIVRSPFGQVLLAIRENEPRAISLGYHVDHYKWLAFVLSTFLAGIAGGTKALAFGIATLTDVHWTMNGQVVLMSLVGGLGTLFGPVVGALALTAMSDYLANFGAWVTVTQGAVFVLCIIAFRRGVVGTLGARLGLKL